MGKGASKIQKEPPSTTEASGAADASTANTSATTASAATDTTDAVSPGAASRTETTGSTSAGDEVPEESGGEHEEDAASISSEESMSRYLRFIPDSERPEDSEELYTEFVECVRQLVSSTSPSVGSGEFEALMDALFRSGAPSYERSNLALSLLPWLRGDDRSRVPPLYWAARLRNVELVRLLVESGRWEVDCRDPLVSV